MSHAVSVDVTSNVDADSGDAAAKGTSGTATAVPTTTALVANFLVSRIAGVPFSVVAFATGVMVGRSAGFGRRVVCGGRSAERSRRRGPRRPPAARWGQAGVEDAGEDGAVPGVVLVAGRLGEAGTRSASDRGSNPASRSSPSHVRRRRGCRQRRILGRCRWPRRTPEVDPHRAVVEPDCDGDGDGDADQQADQRDESTGHTSA